MESVFSEAIANLIGVEVTDRFVSKVVGRRNWVIYCRGDCASLYGYGQACRMGIMQCRLMDIGKNKIRWLEFTYKKDALETLKRLEESGYKII